MEEGRREHEDYGTVLLLGGGTDGARAKAFSEVVM